MPQPQHTRHRLDTAKTDGCRWPLDYHSHLCRNCYSGALHAWQRQWASHELLKFTNHECSEWIATCLAYVMQKE